MQTAVGRLLYIYYLALVPEMVAMDWALLRCMASCSCFRITICRILSALCRLRSSTCEKRLRWCRSNVPKIVFWTWKSNSLRSPEKIYFLLTLFSIYLCFKYIYSIFNICFVWVFTQLHITVHYDPADIQQDSNPGPLTLVNSIDSVSTKIAPREANQKFKKRSESMLCIKKLAYCRV